MNTFDFIGMLGAFLAALGWILLFVLSLRVSFYKKHDKEDELHHASIPRRSLFAFLWIMLSIMTLGISEFLIQILNSKESEGKPVSLAVGLLIVGSILIAISFATSSLL